MRRPNRSRYRPAFDRLDGRWLPSTLTPAQVTQAYGLNAISFSSGGQTVTGDGTGQKIVIVDAFHDPNLVSDLHTFDQTFHLPDPLLGQVTLATSAPKTNDGWALEEMLDVEWAHAIAPGAKIVVIEAKSDSIADLAAAVADARMRPGVSAISMSWGGSEFSGELAYDSLFTTPAGHTGITYIAASGDSGPSAGAEWPASSPNVLSVGGTSLQISSSGAYASESAWSGSSGGYSSYEPEPLYQASVQTTGRRSVPDVSFDADPNTGVYVYMTAPSTGRASWQAVGGTSLGSPAWAGIMAIIDQGRATAGLGTLDGATQTLPDLYALASSDFHEPTSLSSGFRFRPGSGGSSTGTTARYTTTTGLGSPVGPSLIDDLVPGSTTTSVKARSIATTSAATTAATTTRIGSINAFAIVSYTTPLTGSGGLPGNGPLDLRHGLYYHG